MSELPKESGSISSTERTSADLEDEAARAGALFYTPPSQLKINEQIDPLLRMAVAAINSSGWIWTAESCQGHPDEQELTAPWGHNTDPYLRLVCRARYLGPAVAELLTEARDESDRMIGAPQVKLRTRELKDGWIELQVYITAHNAAARNRGCQALERFGFAVQRHRPFPTGKLVRSEPYPWPMCDGCGNEKSACTCLEEGRDDR